MEQQALAWARAKLRAAHGLVNPAEVPQPVNRVRELQAVSVAGLGWTGPGSSPAHLPA